MQAQPGRGYFSVSRSKLEARLALRGSEQQQWAGLVRHAVRAAARSPEPGYGLEVRDHLGLEPFEEIERTQIFTIRKRLKENVLLEVSLPCLTL